MLSSQISEVFLWRQVGSLATETALNYNERRLTQYQLAIWHWLEGTVDYFTYILDNFNKACIEFLVISNRNVLVNILRLLWAISVLLGTHLHLTQTDFESQKITWGK